MEKVYAGNYVLEHGSKNWWKVFQTKWVQVGKEVKAVLVELGSIQIKRNKIQRYRRKPHSGGNDISIQQQLKQVGLI